jgi:hypothetical protein
LTQTPTPGVLKPEKYSSQVRTIARRIAQRQLIAAADELPNITSEQATSVALDLATPDERSESVDDDKESLNSQGQTVPTIGTGGEAG